ncbi:MAG: NADH-quinone oxidoreductase subunit C [Deltaproteobacteria bacterium]|nr:NADH-quinone oxidoreductase subunit C [Deltaproteobacteria bacterium]
MNDDRIKEKLSEKFGADTLQFETYLGQMSILVPSEKILDVGRYLRDDPELKFDFLTFVGGVDYYPARPRFELVYQIYSVSNTQRLRLKARIDDTDSGPASIESVSKVWMTADWHERETAEMFGVVFEGHPDPRKLLLPDEWRVHPLRKDFPLMGTEEDTPDLPS